MGRGRCVRFVHRDVAGSRWGRFGSCRGPELALRAHGMAPGPGESPETRGRKKFLGSDPQGRPVPIQTDRPHHRAIPGPDGSPHGARADGTRRRLLPKSRRQHVFPTRRSHGAATPIHDRMGSIPGRPHRRASDLLPRKPAECLHCGAVELRVRRRVGIGEGRAVATAGAVRRSGPAVASRWSA
jgi:hypothetical protein